MKRRPAYGPPMRQILLAVAAAALPACAHMDAERGSMMGDHYRRETARVTGCGVSQIEISDTTQAPFLGVDAWTAEGCGRRWKCSRATRDPSGRADCIPQ